MMTSTVAQQTLLKIFIIISISSCILCHNDDRTPTDSSIEHEDSNIYYIKPLHTELLESRQANKNISAIASDSDEASESDTKGSTKLIKRRKNSALNAALQKAAVQGLNAMLDLYERVEPEIIRKGEFLAIDHPAAKLNQFSAPMNNKTDFDGEKAAYASLFVAKKLQESVDFDITGLGRQNGPKKKVSLRRTPLEALCPPRDPPQCVPATRRYRTHDGSCNNHRKPRWGSAHMPFHRFLHPEYSDGLEEIRGSVNGGQLPSARFVSLVVHGYRDEESQVTMMLLQWGQLIDHDLTATLQPRSINGSIPRCCESETVHPACLPMKVPRDDPFLARLGVRCLEFLRSAPAQRRDCFLSWREQTNQVTSYLDASCVYSSNPRTADSARILRDGLLLYGRGNPREDICLHGGFGHQCIRAGDSRAGEQPGLLALHTVFVAEHNRIALALSDLNPHWSDEKLYQETRRIIGAMFQHITYREFLPLVLGREVCRLFDLELKTTGYYDGYDSKVNPTVANAFSAAAFRFGHAMVQGTILRSDANYRFINNNVTLHEENSHGDIGDNGSLHRIIRGLTSQRTLKRDEFMSPELTNHLFQSGPFPFGMDLAAINIQRGRDHGIPAYVNWREPCGLSRINSWEDLEVVAGPESANRMRRAYTSVDDIDLFVGGLSERPVRGGLVGPTFACIIAQQFSNLRKGDRFWYENSGFESSFTVAQLNALRQVTLSQILCRSLGSGNLMQPVAFLPHEFIGNERLRCGSGILEPMNLNPWIERDPFNKEANFETNNFIEPQITIFLTDDQETQESQFQATKSTTTLNPLLNFDQVPDVTFTVGKPQPTARPNKPSISSNLDFTATTSKPKLTTTKKPTVTISDKIDFSTKATSTTKKKRKTTVTTTKRPNASLIDNKIDFKATTAKTTTKRTPSNSPFSKTANNTATILVRKSTQKKKKKKEPTDKLQHRSDDIDTTDEIPVPTKSDLRKKSFRNEDNATKYLDNIAQTMTIQNDIKTNSTEKIESRINHNFYSGTGNIKQNDNYYNYNYNNQKYYDEYRPNYDKYGSQRPSNNHYPLYPPLTQPEQTTVKRPVAYTNNRPTYNSASTKPRPEQKPQPISPISNKLSTPFSYDTSFNGPTIGPNYSPITPSMNYDNMAIPLYVSPNRFNNKRPAAGYYSNRQTYATTKKADISTFLIVETTRRTSPVPQHYFISVDRTTKRPSNDQFSISSSHLLHSLLPVSAIGNFYPSSEHEDTAYSNVSYIISSTNNKKITNKPSHVMLTSQVYKPSYYSGDSSHEQDDFDGYLRPENSFYPPFTNNYKASYTSYKKYDQRPDTTTVQTVKYYYKGNVLHKYHPGKGREGLDEDEIDTTTLDDLSNDETLARTLDTDHNHPIKDVKTKKLDDTRQKFGTTFFVPFKLLTRIERPDNWVHTNVTDDDKTKMTLPDVPTINQDENSTRELPRPINLRPFGG